MANIRKNLIAILESQLFEQLEVYKSRSTWKDFKEEDRLLLARLIVMQGKKQLAEGNCQALESFEQANEIASNALDILYEQALILSSYQDNIRCLILALQALNRLSEIHSPFFKGLSLQAQVLMEIGLFEGNVFELMNAKDCFEKAFFLLENNESENLQEFYWKWGSCLAHIGKFSGEPIDFHQAIEKYQFAFELGCQESLFFHAFGSAYLDLVNLLERPHDLVQALSLFESALKVAPGHFDSWYQHARCLQKLAEVKREDKLLEQAEESFLKASEIESEESQLWLSWAELEVMISKSRRDIERLRKSFLKFTRAHQLNLTDPQILNSWADAELFLGVQEEQLDLIHSARLKIIKSLEMDSKDPHTWYLYGSCLNELGFYFNEASFYHEAIEKFQYGISLNRQEPFLWYGLALSHFALGELTEEKNLFEKSIRSFSRVIEYRGEVSANFWNNWGLALLKLAEFTDQSTYVEMAIEKFENALKQPMQEEVELEWVYNYGCALGLLGDLKEEPSYFEKAAEVLSQILQIEPDFALARYHLALVLSRLGEAIFDVDLYYKAIEHFEYLVNQEIEDDMMHLDFGIALTHLGLIVQDPHYPEKSQLLYQRAEMHFIQAAALGNTQSYYQLAGLYSITEHFDQAMHYLEKAQFYNSLPEVEDLLHDEWLEAIKQTPAFRQFISAL